MYRWWKLCILYLHEFQMSAAVGDPGLCCYICVSSFERYLTPLCVDSLCTWIFPPRMVVIILFLAVSVSVYLCLSACLSLSQFLRLCLSLSLSIPLYFSTVLLQLSSMYYLFPRNANSLQLQLFVILLLKKAEKKTVASTEKQASVTKQELSFSVSFTEVGAFADVRMLSAFLHNGEMVACGAGSPGGALLPDLKGMNLASGVVSSKRQQLPQRMKNFAIQTLNIPQAFVEQGT